jgi:hypothetical protein
MWIARASADFGSGPVGSTMALRIRRMGAELDVTVARGDRMPAQYSHPSIDRLDDGVYYIDLGRARLTEIDAIMDRLAAAPVVYDMRGYPSSNHAVLSHLLTRADDSKAWMAVPHVGWHSPRRGRQTPVLRIHDSCP